MHKKSAPSDTPALFSQNARPFFYVSDSFFRPPRDAGKKERVLH